MSKIQKALDSIRNSPGSKSPDAKRPVVQSGNRSAGHGGVHQQGLEQPDEFVSDLIPVGKVHIDIASLVELRMFPEADDEEVVAQQFSRIKRPILQLAFENSLPCEDHTNVVMMASALPGAGKSFCALNLVRSIALERDYGAVLVDADVLKPGISRALGLEDQVGLIDYLVDPEIDLSEVMYTSDLNDIIVIPAGRRHPEATELLASRRMRELVKRLSEHYLNHAVVFDTPPLLLTSEAQVLAERVGQIVMVVEARKSSQESVMRALGMLDRDKPINAILNKSRSADSGGYHSDDYGYYSSSAKYARRSSGNETNS